MAIAGIVYAAIAFGWAVLMSWVLRREFRRGRIDWLIAVTALSIAWPFMAAGLIAAMLEPKEEEDDEAL